MGSVYHENSVLPDGSDTENVEISFIVCDSQSKSDNLEWDDGYIAESPHSEKPYEDEQIYDMFFMKLPWKKFTLDVDFESKDVLIVLLCANRAGSRRTRVLVVGPEDDLKCMIGIHPLSQPVLYTTHSLESEQLIDWFNFQFVPANSDEFLPCLLICAENIQCDGDCLSYDGKDTLRFQAKLPEKEERRLQNIRNVMHARYCLYLLEMYAQYKEQYDNFDFNKFLKCHFNFKVAIPLIHRSWMETDVELSADHESILSNLTDQLTDAVRILGLSDRRIDEETDFVKIEIENKFRHEPGEQEATETSIPTASQTASLLETALLWMETQPIEPDIIIGIRQIASHIRKACFYIIFYFNNAHFVLKLSELI